MPCEALSTRRGFSYGAVAGASQWKVVKLINKAYLCPLYPNKDQRDQIEKTFGACRWVWNLALETKKAAWEYEKKSLSCTDLCKQLTVWKKTVAPWLYEVSNAALQQSLRDLDKAYQNFFRRVKRGEKPGYPKRKSRRASRQSYRVPCGVKGIEVLDERHIKLPKLGVVRFRETQPIEGRILSATIKRVPTGKYFVVLCCGEVPEPEMPMGDVDILGVDAGIKEGALMAMSNGKKVRNPKYLKQYEKQLKRAQRKLSRRKRGSANYEKQRLKVARIHEKIANSRHDHIHKGTIQAVRDAQIVAVENLNVEGMKKNRNLAKSVSDASMSEAIRQLKYKSEWYGRDFVKVDRWFPSTQICGCCGMRTGPRGKKELSKEHWTCPECGTYHDRDLNAANNIAHEGAMLLAQE